MPIEEREGVLANQGGGQVVLGGAITLEKLEALVVLVLNAESDGPCGQTAGKIDAPSIGPSVRAESLEAGARSTFGVEIDRPGRQLRSPCSQLVSAGSRAARRADGELAAAPA